MKRTLLIGAMMLATSSLTLSAQKTAKVSSQEAFDYNRCSLSIIALNGMTSYDDDVNTWTSSTDFDGKFDMNKIATTGISTSSNSDKIKNVLIKENVGKQVLNYWLQYDGTKFSSKLMENRSSYNATDADVLRDQASKVKTLNLANKTLLNNSFVMVTGPTSVERKVTKKGEVYYEALIDAYVYKVNLNDSILTTVWENWLDESANSNNKSIYDNLNVEIDYVASVTKKSGVGENPAQAINEAFGEILDPLEKKIGKWQVVTSIYRKHPLGAKIGKKEGLKNSDRYRAFKVVEDQNGNLEYKKVGFVRATKVINNTNVATGESDCSNFYQISGRTLREGMFLKQKKDIKLSVSGSYNTGGYNIAQVDIDYLVHTSNVLGVMQYAGLSIGYDDGKDGFSKKKAIYIPVTLNYGIGIHPVRILEILPSIGVGADYYSLPSDDSSDDSKFDKQLAYFAHGGVKVGLQIFYPIQIFVRADYSYKFSEGELYKECISHKRFEKLSFGAGLKINF